MDLKLKERIYRGFWLWLFVFIWGLITYIFTGILSYPIIFLIMLGIPATTVPSLAYIYGIQAILFFVFLPITWYIMGVIVPYLPMKEKFLRKFGEANRDKI